MTLEEIQDEIKEVYDNCKNKFKLKRLQIDKDVVEEGGTINTDYFRYNLYALQSTEDPSQYCIYRLLFLRKLLEEMPGDIGEIFPFEFIEIVIPINSKILFDEIVEEFEVYEELVGGNLVEDDKFGKISYTTTNGFKIFVETKQKIFIVQPPFIKRKTGIQSLIEQTKTELMRIMGGNIKLLE
jgi:hypothetical protein